MKLQTGNIGLVYWNEEVITPMSEEQRQQIIDQDSRASMYALIQSATLNPNQGYIDVQEEYAKSRRQGAERAEGLRKTTVVKKAHTQIGQKESIEELLEIEKNQAFRGWHDPELISRLINYKTEEE